MNGGGVSTLVIVTDKSMRVCKFSLAIRDSIEMVR